MQSENIEYYLGMCVCFFKQDFFDFCEFCLWAFSIIVQWDVMINEIGKQHGGDSPIMSDTERY